MPQLHCSPPTGELVAKVTVSCHGRRAALEGRAHFLSLAPFCPPPSQSLYIIRARTQRCHTADTNDNLLGSFPHSLNLHCSCAEKYLARHTMSYIAIHQNRMQRPLFCRATCGPCPPLLPSGRLRRCGRPVRRRRRPFQVRAK